MSRAVRVSPEVETTFAKCVHISGCTEEEETRATSKQNQPMKESSHLPAKKRDEVCVCKADVDGGMEGTGKKVRGM